MRKYYEPDTRDGWQTWFAWYPVCVNLGGGRDVTIWWEKVERKTVSTYGEYITYYRNADGSNIE